MSASRTVLGLGLGHLRFVSATFNIHTTLAKFEKLLPFSIKGARFTENRYGNQHLDKSHRENSEYMQYGKDA